MKSRRAGWLLLGGFVATLAGATYVGFNPPAGEPIRIIDALWAASFVGFPTAGALVINRYPRRPLGWILSLAPLLLMFGVLCSEVARFGVRDPGFPGAWIYWLGTITFNVGMGLLLLTPLFLPNGLLLSRRWRAVILPLVIYTMLAVVVAAVGPWERDEGIANPIGIPALAGFFDLVEAMVGVAAIWALGFGILSLILRFRRSTGVERQQMKMLALGALGVAACLGALATTEAILGDQSDFVATIFIIFAILSLPASIALAVMRYRLYDVDVVINRTLVYATLTGILALSYLGIVFLLQAALTPITRESDLAVAGSTLAVAALFRPLRDRVQTFIDKRFYRSRYDAAETLSEFSARLRNEVDLDALGRELVGVVGQTMEPAHATLWLRNGAAR